MTTRSSIERLSDDAPVPHGATTTNGNWLTAERLRAVLYYEQSTGVFTYRVRRGRLTAGSVAGTTDHIGYRCIEIDQRPYAAHRLAWLYMTGSWPFDQIDHINLDRTDNRWCNLREATRAQNEANKPLQTNNKCGLKGVSRDRRRWRATIQIAKKQIFLGAFGCPAAAHFAYIIAARAAFGEFARSA